MSKVYTIAQAISTASKVNVIEMPAECLAMENAATAKMGEGISIVQNQCRTFVGVCGSTANKMARAAVSGIGYKMEIDGELVPRTKANSKPAPIKGDKMLEYASRCAPISQDAFDAIVEQLKKAIVK